MRTKDKIKHPIFGWSIVADGFILDNIYVYTDKQSLTDYVKLYGYHVDGRWSLATLKQKIEQQHTMRKENFK